MKIVNFSKSYENKAVFEHFNLVTDDKKITCILGESGCGKTTLLNAVAGLIPYGGSIEAGRVSYLFQTHRLIPNLTVIKNLEIIGADANSATNMLKRVGLEQKKDAYPSSLSGGEAQRVALCRALLFASDIILLDEPFSSLDLKSKLSVMQLFKELCREEEREALFVTHDVDEAVFLADRIVVIGGGAISADIENAESSQFGANSPVREKIVNILLGK